jgi:hypothetical protein
MELKDFGAGGLVIDELGQAKQGNTRNQGERADGWMNNRSVTPFNYYRWQYGSSLKGGISKIW